MEFNVGQNIVVNGTQLQIMDWLGKGLTKRAWKVKIASGEFQGTEAAFVLGYPFEGRHYFDRDVEFNAKMKSQKIAAAKGLAPQLYDYSFRSEYGPFSLQEIAVGIDLCRKQLSKERLTDEELLHLLQFIIDLAKIGIVNPDSNCYNYILKPDGNWIVIDDLFTMAPLNKDINITAEYAYDIPAEEKIYTAIEIVKNLQQIHGTKLAIYTRIWSRANPEENTITTLTVESPKEMYRDFFEKANNILKEAAEELGYHAAGGGAKRRGKTMKRSRKVKARKHKRTIRRRY